MTSEEEEGSCTAAVHGLAIGLELHPTHRHAAAKQQESQRWLISNALRDTCHAKQQFSCCGCGCRRGSNWGERHANPLRNPRISSARSHLLERLARWAQIMHSGARPNVTAKAFTRGRNQTLLAAGPGRPSPTSDSWESADGNPRRCRSRLST